MRPQNRMQENGGRREQPGFAPGTQRPVYGGGSGSYGSRDFGGTRQPYGGEPGAGQTAPRRPAYTGGTYTEQPYGAGQRPDYASPRAAPPGHLEDWLNRHQNTPFQDQERMLRNSPAFNRQAPAEQQREIQQLHQLNQMPEAQRDRRLARNELLERLSPQQRMSLNHSTREWSALPPGRQTMMKQAFRDLRNVPPDQRETVLNSARYQGMFSPEERGILSDFLRVEPYQPH